MRRVLEGLVTSGDVPADVKIAALMAEVETLEICRDTLRDTNMTLLRMLEQFADMAHTASQALREGATRRGV